jgi:TonB family protein
MSWKRSSLPLLLAAVFTLTAGSFAARSESPVRASEFYIVSVGFSDASPGWHHSVLEIRPEGSDVLARYIRSGPASMYCGTATTIVTASARLANTSLLATIGGLDLCAIDQAAIDRTIRAAPPTDRTAVYAGDRFAIVAKCGTSSKIVRLPGAWELDMARLKRGAPGIAELFTLEQRIGAKLFGSFPTIDVVPAEMESQLRPADAAILAELSSGKFDAGLAPHSFKDDVARLLSDSDIPKFGVKLVNADRLRFAHYVTPQYPRRARPARIHGTVELELSSNPATGEIREVVVISGHALLAEPAKEAAQHWRFVPETDTTARAVRVVLEFTPNCP